MDARSFDVLHDARDHDVFSVGHRIHFALHTGYILVHKDSLKLRVLRQFLHIVFQFIRSMDDLHVPSPQDIGWSEEHRVADSIGRLQGFFFMVHNLSFRHGDGKLF